MNEEGFNNGLGNIPLFNLFTGAVLDNEGRNSLQHDSYHVYVNDDFVGDKILMGESEGMSDVTSYLTSQGFHNFSANLDGNHFNIYSNDAAKIKKTLNVYLKIR